MYHTVSFYLKKKFRSLISFLANAKTLKKNKSQIKFEILRKERNQKVCSERKKNPKNI